MEGGKKKTKQKIKKQTNNKNDIDVVKKRFPPL